MIYKTILPLLCALLLNNFHPSDTCKLSGEFHNMTGSDYLYMLDVNNGKVIDMIIVRNGKFSYSTPLEKPRPVIFYSKKNNSRRKVVWLEASDVKLSGNYDFINNLKVEGSESHQLYSDFTDMVKSFKRKINKAEEHVNWDLLEIQEGNKNTLDPALQNTLDSLKTNASETIMKYLIEHKSSVVSLELLYNHCFLSFYSERLRNRYLLKEHAQKVFDSLPRKNKLQTKSEEIRRYLQQPEIPKKKGDYSIDFKQERPDGNSIRLSELKGKYVLIYFWSTLCKPCIASFPELKEIYRKYQKGGFEIFSVADDRDKEKWLKIVRDNSLPWINGIDTNGFELSHLYNEAFNYYETHVYGSFLLIDKEGKVLSGSNIKDNPIRNKEDLSRVLKEVFGF